MLKGRILNVTPKYSPEAEEALSKAVKLDPRLVDAWNHLGECYWKKEDVSAAKNCFTGALNHVCFASFCFVLFFYGLFFSLLCPERTFVNPNLCEMV